jgi:hypothetical protein
MRVGIMTADIVSVFVYGRTKHRAECSCSWEGKLRWTLGRAIIDALLHALDTGCHEGWPLTVRHHGRLPASAHRRTPWWMWTSAAGAIIGTALFFSAATAHADEVTDYTAHAAAYICDTIAEKPYVSTVMEIEAVLTADTGRTDGFVGAVLGTAVRDYCPWNRPTLYRWIAVFTPANEITVPHGAVGGRI